MSEQAGIDVHRVVWSAEYEPIEVLPSPDAPGYVCARPKGAESAEFWGAFSLTMPADFARQLGKALIDSANEQESA